MAERLVTSVRPIVRAARLLSAVVALLMPVGYFTLAYQRLDATLLLESRVIAQWVTRHVNANPRLWVYEDHRLEGLLARDAIPGKALRRIVSSGGRLVSEVDQGPEVPLLTRSAEVFDAGQPVARVEVSRSLRGLLGHTFAAGAAGALLGFAVYATLKLFPLRALRLALDSLWEEKEKAEVTLASVAEAVVATDAAGRIELMNPAAEALAGRPSQDGRGRPFSDVFPLVGSRSRVAWVGPWERPAATSERTWLLGDQTRGRCSVTLAAAPIRRAGGARAGYVLVVQDVTEWERLEGELVRAQKLESLGVLAGGIAHDFNNLLMSVTANVEMAALYADGDAKVAHRLETAMAASLRAKDLTQRLLAFSRGGVPVRRAVDLTPLLREVDEFATSAGRSALTLNLPPDLWAVEADEGQMSQVISNLVSNAHQATAGGGTIAAEACNVEVGIGGHQSLLPGRYVRMTVRDEGVGIAPGDLGKIFDPYFSTKPMGTGLGLATTYAIVRDHGGVVEVASEPGKGTRFDVYLPAAVTAPTPKPPPSESPRPGGLKAVDGA